METRRFVTCTKCDYTGTNEEFAAHLFKYHTNEGKTECFICGKFYSDLRTHIQRSKRHKRLVESKRKREESKERSQTKKLKSSAEIEPLSAISVSTNPSVPDEPIFSQQLGANNSNNLNLIESQDSAADSQLVPESALPLNSSENGNVIERELVPGWKRYSDPRYFKTDEPPKLPYAQGFLLQWMRSFFISSSAMEKLLHALANFSDEDLLLVGNSLSTLKRIEATMLSYPGKYEFPTDKFVIIFNSILDCITLFLDDDKLRKKMVFDYSDNNGIISHPSHGLIWKHFDQKKAELSIKNDKDYLLIVPIWWFDEYQQCKTSRRNDTAIVVTLANFPTKEIAKRRNKILIALLPPGTDFVAAVNHIVILPCLELQKGVHLKSNRYEWDVCGTGGFVAGDQKAQCQALQTIGACAKYAPCRFSYAAKSELGITRLTPNVPIPPDREGPEAFNFVTKWVGALSADSGEKGLAEEMLRKRGYLPKVSPFMWLDWMHKYFFLHFPLDNMHLSYEGNFPRHITYLAAKSGPAMIESLNQLATRFSIFPTLRYLRQGIVKYTKKYGRRVLKTAHRTAAEMESFVQIAECVGLHLLFKNLISVEDFKCLQEHVKIDNAITGRTFERDKLEELQDSICRFKEHFKATLCEGHQEEEDEVEMGGVRNVPQANEEKEENQGLNPMWEEEVPDGAKRKPVSKESETASVNQEEENEEEKEEEQEEAEDDENTPTFDDEDDDEEQRQKALQSKQKGSKLLTSGFTANYMNFHSTEYWGKIIAHCGPPDISLSIPL